MQVAAGSFQELRHHHRADEGRVPESDEEGEGMEGGVDGDELKSDGLHHPRGRIIRKVYCF